jgi:hypothetical protein
MGESRVTDIGILDLLALCGFDPACRSKLVRHQDKRYDVQEMLRRGWIDAYQAFQGRKIFERLDYIVSFIGQSGGYARLLGVYKVGARRAASDAVLPPGCPYTEWLRPDHFHYDLVRQGGYEALENRVVIHWGPAARTWDQIATNKPVHHMLPKGQLVEVFADYLDFTLSHSELQYLIAHAEKNAEWRARLSAVAGIYLVLDSLTGRQYVGSAYGAEGIWGRWVTYAKDGHGGNAALRALVDANPAHPAAFTYSILQILPKTTAKAEVLALEQRYKAKLGSLATGLNEN